MPARLGADDIRALWHEPFSAVGVSALTKQNMALLEETLAAWARDGHTDTEEPFLVNERHLDVFTRLEEALRETLDAAARAHAEEVLAFHLRTALQILGELTGETAPDEILDIIFSKFCVGK